ncbi:Alpha/beta hydrolase family protein [compost metagenome]
MNLARCFSRHIVLAGHSTGGILAMNAAIDNPDEVMGLMLWSPAVKLTKMAWLGGPIGKYLGLSGNTFKWTTPDHDETTYYSPNSSVQLEILINTIVQNQGDGKGLRGMYEKLTMPTFLAYAENDPVINVHELTVSGYQIPGIRDVMYFKSNTGIWHESIAKFPEDAYRSKKWDYNVKYRDMKYRMETFLSNILF